MKRTCRLVLLVVLLMGLAPIAETADFKVVINVANPMNSITTKELSGLFLKKTQTWPDGRTVVAVDLKLDSPLRAEFTSVVHGKKISSIKSYWQRQIFQGRAVPPMQKASEAEVLEFVAKVPGAVGYVSSSTPLSANVKELTVKD